MASACQTEIPFEENKGGIILEHASPPMPAQKSPLPQDPPSLTIGQCACPLENLSEHLFGQLPSLGVLVRGMIRSQQDAPIR